mgnify:CR=1 FL=1
MYQLCIDQGNSSTKIGIFDGDALLDSLVYEVIDVIEISKLISRFSFEGCILSSVVEFNDELINFLKSTFSNFVILDHNTLLPIENLYKTPETLGKDRIAAVVGASYLQPDADLLVIDAGTAITYDFIDSQKAYHGGNIAPGIDMRLRALHEFTRKLPLVKAEKESPLLGTDTQSAILSGVLHGIVFEINGYIDAIKFKYPELLVFLTGGSIFYFDRKLKNAIFAEKNLVLIGLNRIYRYNVQK